jgi:hypothetical protein
MRALAFVVVVAAASCGPHLPVAPPACDDKGVGCLSDEQCVDGKCLPLPKCTQDSDCKAAAFECTFPAQVCQLRQGFGQQCHEPEAPCDPNNVCELGVCYPTDPHNPNSLAGCSHDSDCDFGEKCDERHFVCIEAADCRLANKGFPELACDLAQQETCSETTGQCNLPCQNECQTNADCAPFGPSDSKCNGSCQCVECLIDTDCGPGLHCSRSGACASDNSCSSSRACPKPLVCGASGLCEDPPPPCASDFDCPLGQKCDVGTSVCFSPQGDCVDDFLEPSNTPATAHNFPFDSNGDAGTDGLELCPNNDDVYSITLNNGDHVTITVTGTDPAARATLWLLDSSGNTSLAFAATPPLGNGTITYIAHGDETVFIRVTALLAATSYTLAIHRVPGQACQADAFEGAGGNDSIATAATGVPDNVGLAGTICPNDVDFFHVTVNAGEALNANLTFDGTQTDLDVAFFDSSGNLIAQAADANEPEVLRQRFVNAQDVFVRVTGFGNDIGDYILTLRHDPPFACTDDNTEPDNDVAHAVPVPLNQGLAADARTMCNGDEDWLLAPLEDFERLVVATTYQESDLKLTIDVLDATGTTVKQSSPPEFGGAAISYNANGNETVAVRIRAVGGAIGPYSLVVTKENQNDCTPDDFEPNDTVATASPTLPLPGQLLSICTSDEDFFQIPLHAGKTVVADASFREADADIDLQLIGLDGVQILTTADGSADGEHLEFTVPLDGTYTLRVFSATSPANAHYTLNVVEQ